MNLPGTLKNYPHRNEVRLAITKQQDLLYIIKEIFNKFPLLNNKQRLRYYKLKQGILNNIKKFKSIEEFNNYLPIPDEIMEDQLRNFNPNLVGNWLAGFISGEGSFAIKKIKRGTTVYLVKEFCIEQTDLNVIELIKDKFKFSTKINVKKRLNRPNSKTTYEIRISSIKDIGNLINYLENQEIISLLGNKLNQSDGGDGV